MIPFEETPAWYHAADLFVCASQSETQGITYLEALSAGLPVVCRRDECVEGIVRSGYNGYTYETPEEFAAFCRLLAGEEDRRRRFGERAAKTGREYSACRFGERVLEAYERTLKEKERSGKKNRPDRSFFLAYIEHMYYNKGRTDVRIWRRTWNTGSRRADRA